MATTPIPIKKATRAPPPASLAETDPSLNRWLQDLPRVLNGVIPPPNENVSPFVKMGLDGDWYCDTVAKHIYVKINKAWVLIV